MRSASEARKPKLPLRNGAGRDERWQSWKSLSRRCEAAPETELPGQAKANGKPSQSGTINQDARASKRFHPGALGQFEEALSRGANRPRKKSEREANLAQYGSAGAEAHTHPLPPYEQESGIDPVTISCPSCGAKALTVNGAVATWIQIPESHCPCGYSGVIEWTNPHLQDVSLAQAG